MYKYRKVFPYVQFRTWEAEMPIDALDVQEGIKLGTRSWHGLAAREPAVRHVLYVTMSCKKSDEQPLHFFCNKKQTHKNTLAYCMYEPHTRGAIWASTRMQQERLL